MDNFGDMLELIDCQRFSLGNVEQGLILLFFSQKPTTVYDICSYWESSKSSMSKRPMLYENIRRAYKNEHKRVKRLKELKLIEEVSGNYPKGAKPYKLTTTGLFQYLLLGGLEAPPTSSKTSTFTMSRENIIMQLLLYQYFEEDTIMKFNNIAIDLLGSYLRKCCEAIINNLEGGMLELFTSYSPIENSNTNKPGKYERLKNSSQVWSLLRDVEYTIKNEMRNFVYEIIRESAYDYSDFFSTGNIDWINEHRSTFPVPVLIKDKKFMEVFNDVKLDFDEGCKLFV